MTMTHASGVELDICKYCDAVWFDKGEFINVVNKLLSNNKIKDRPDKGYQRESVNSLNNYRLRKLACPRCETPLDVRNFSFDSNVFVDRCNTCGGLWVDKGELLEIIDYMKYAHRFENYADSIAELYKEKEIKLVKFIRVYQNFFSVSIGAIYILLAYFISGPQNAWAVTIKFLPMPFFLIWFGDELGKYIGFIPRPPFWITKTTPGSIVKLAGWIILLSPVIVFSIKLVGLIANS
jgi:Zn-finger nucleic acid-binding protein